jgi:hypothetical protein
MSGHLHPLRINDVMKTLIKNEILEEVWQIKDALGAKHDYNIDAIFRDLQKREKTSGRRYVDLSKPKAKIAAKKK